eukprot:TRINITY_DN2030_c0_g1_i2.p1 TRINITY_DN2030_c0_g1~~TRINITY_DN2030_c0_g1_i2.p1  ORF type:complete len:175 (-),score=32.67 TRINITY_DN2030_c0_g1_i2:282-782(-)
MLSFDQYRREARGLENEIDSKLANYSKYSASLSQNSLRDDDSTSLLANDVSSSMGAEIEQLIHKLGEVNDNLTKTSDSSTLAVNHISNHRSKLHDFTNEFKRVKTQITSAREHAELLISVRDDISQYKNTGGTRQDNLLRERGSIHASDRVADSIIGYSILKIFFG